MSRRAREKAASRDVGADETSRPWLPQQHQRAGPVPPTSKAITYRRIRVQQASPFSDIPWASTASRANATYAKRLSSKNLGKTQMANRY